jgi:hypothetical protein
VTPPGRTLFALSKSFLDPGVFLSKLLIAFSSASEK